ncbi:MAG: hypothetical protein K6G00_09525 [Treponema sp.]|nr:hypothetical protein [Treponema sp.]
MFFNNNLYYKPDWKKIKNQIKSSDLLITDGTHRIAGIKILKDTKHSALVTYIGIRVEIPFAKQSALEYGNRIISDSRFSFKLVRDCIVGETVYYESKSNENLEKAINQSDVIITDGMYYAVGLIYDRKKNESTENTFLE